MNFYGMTDKAILAELGNRLKNRRLRFNRTQKELADAVKVSTNTIKSLEKGKGKLENLIPILRELQLMDQLDNFIPPQEISPIQLQKLQGRRRQRASGKREKDVSEW